jgi:hypothetical protein
VRDTRLEGTRAEARHGLVEAAHHEPDIGAQAEAGGVTARDGADDTARGHHDRE